ncbi:PHOsphatase [Gonapodya sp. JEL0774]|nr:PHOsphatase [Gonapodya sp. JEL0774]
MLARHGSRNPTNGDVKTHIALQQKLAASPPTNPNFGWLANISIPSSSTNQGLLTLQGANDHAGLANRIKTNYPVNLFASVNLTSWKSTNSSRVISSGDSFADSLYSDRPGDAAIAKSHMRDAIAPQTLDAELRPFDACAAYANASNIAKANNLQDQVYAAATFPPIAQRIGSLIGANITVTDVTALFSLCSFENTLQGKTDGICSLFTDDELAAYDFQQDLGNDVNEMYALEINNVLTCSLITTFVQNMESMINASTYGCNSTAPTAVFRFAHEETVAPLLVALGLFDREVLNPNFTAAQIANRKLRYSAASPFAANVIFELQNCGMGPADYVVRVLHNEVPIVVPGCTITDCPFEIFKTVLSDKVGCDFDGKVCGNANGTVGTAATYKNLGDAPVSLLVAAAAK